MKIKKKFIVLGVICFMLASCYSTKKAEEKTMFIAPETSQNSLEWTGTYSGIVPCADCEGIEIELSLEKDLNYKLISKYLGKNDDKVFTQSGKFKWDGNNIILDGIKNAPSIFKIEENQIRQLDMQGKEITGSTANNYLLFKNGNAQVEDKRWRLIELNGQPIRGTAATHYIIFHSKDGRIDAKANCNVLHYNYKIKNKLHIQFSGGISTLMACPDDIEKDFIKVLSEVDNLAVNETNLSLNKSRMSPLARFELVK